MTERTIATYGLRGMRVRVYTLRTSSGTEIVRAEWREGGKRVRESWPDSRDNRRTAKGYAEGVAARLAQRTAPARQRITLGELVQKYRAANDHWRPATLSSRLYRLGKFLHFANETLYADTVTPEMLDEFRAEMRRVVRAHTGKPMVPNQVAACASEVKSLLRFGKHRRLIAENPLDGYVVRLAKNEVRDETHEFSNDEWARILAELSPRAHNDWRAYALMVLAGVLGPRQKALRHLTWADVDLNAREVTWRREYAKMGKESTQPLPRAAVRVFRIARVWARRDGYAGPWIFYGADKRTIRKGTPYTYSALNYRLHEAERRAGVESMKYRAMHGFRRTAAGNVLELTGGDLKAAGDWIGDSDLKSIQKYVKKRSERQKEVAGMVLLPAARKARKRAKKTTEQPTAASRQGEAGT